jgi:hypothetical protein
MTTHKVMDHPWLQEIQQLHMVQRETPEPHVARQVSVWLRLAQQGTTRPCEAYQALSRPHEAEILEGLPVQAEEPQGDRCLGEPSGGLPGHRGGRTYRGESGPDGGNHGI